MSIGFQLGERSIRPSNTELTDFLRDVLTERFGQADIWRDLTGEEMRHYDFPEASKVNPSETIHRVYEVLGRMIYNGTPYTALYLTEQVSHEQMCEGVAQKVTDAGVDSLDGVIRFADGITLVTRGENTSREFSHTLDPARIDLLKYTARKLIERFKEFEKVVVFYGLHGTSEYKCERVVSE